MLSYVLKSIPIYGSLEFEEHFDSQSDLEKCLDFFRYGLVSCHNPPEKVEMTSKPLFHGVTVYTFRVNGEIHSMLFATTVDSDVPKEEILF